MTSPIAGAASGLKGAKGDKGEPGMTAATRRAFVVLTLIVFGLSAAALYIGVRQVNAFNTALHAQCRFDSDIGGAPITVNPATGKPSKLGVQIVTDARTAYEGLHCPGILPPAAPSLLKWARYYRLPVR